MLLLPPPAGTQHAQAREGAPPGTRIGWHLDLGLPASSTVRSILSLKSPHLWYLPVAAQAS